MADNGDEVTYFAKTNFRNKERMFGIQKLDRRQHMYVIGQTGTGKSTFLKNMALQDIKNGCGICIVDPHGEFVEDVLTMIPPDRVNDVIYFNPADSDYPLGFNVLEIPDLNNPQYKPLAASSLMGIFTKIWANVWSARMEYILNNAILALLDTPGETLLGVQRILVDKPYRNKILANVKDPVVKAFWVGEYELYEPRFRNEAIAPIQNKVGQFLSSSIVRNIIGQPQSTFNLYDAMNSKKIILVNVSKGRVGEDNSQLLGAMIITKLQLAAMERVRIPEHLREDFYLYVDEFQNFATDSFASILSEARKYRLNLLIAHQYIGQLVTDTSTRVRDAVFGNIGTTVLFRVGATDAEFLEKELAPEVTIEDMVGLPNHNIFLKLMINQVRSRPFSAATLPPLAIDVEEGTVDKIIAASRSNYAKKKEEVEEAIIKWAEPTQKPMEESKGGRGTNTEVLQNLLSQEIRRTNKSAPTASPAPVSTTRPSVFPPVYNRPSHERVQGPVPLASTPAHPPMPLSSLKGPGTSPPPPKAPLHVPEKKPLVSQHTPQRGGAAPTLDALRSALSEALQKRSTAPATPSRQGAPPMFHPPTAKKPFTEVREAPRAHVPAPISLRALTNQKSAPIPESVPKVELKVEPKEPPPVEKIVNPALTNINQHSSPRQAAGRSASNGVKSSEGNGTLKPGQSVKL